MAAKKSEPVESKGAPSPGSAMGDGGKSVQGYFQEQDQVEGTHKNPKRSLPANGEPDLISTVEACKLMNQTMGYLMYDPAGLYRDCGKSAPAAHEIESGALRFSRSECSEFADEWKRRKAERKRIKAEEAAFAAENAEFQASITAR